MLRVTCTETKVYPTLISTEFKVDITYPDNGEVKVEIYNSNGKMVHKELFPKEQYHSSFNVKLGNLSNGLYIVKISINDFSETHKIIVK